VVMVVSWHGGGAQWGWLCGGGDVWRWRCVGVVGGGDGRVVWWG
jgi:hypothetical protein